MSDSEQQSSGESNVFWEILDALAVGLKHRNKANPPTPDRYATDWKAVNHYDHIVLYHGDEVAMKVRPEGADDIVGQLSLALRQRRSENHGE